MSRRLALLAIILLIGAALRLRGLSVMLDMAHYDEAYYAVDALSLIEQPRLTPFFPDNFGRESLWMYWIAPALAIFGGGAFPLRIMAAFTGILTLAAAYALARELVGRRAAIYAAAGLAVLFPHVLASHEAFRALLFPLVGTLAFAVLCTARRANRMRWWIAGGVLLGALFYTYLAARLWMALAGLMLLWWFVREPDRRGIAIAAGLAFVLWLPLIATLLANPAASQRVDQVAVTDFDQLLQNIVIWLRAPFLDGSPDVMFNLPGRPLLDLPLAILFVAGVVWLVLKRRAAALIVALLAAVSVAPALLTTEPLKWLRAIGVYVPLAIMLGAGAVGLEKVGAARRMVWILPALLMIIAAANTARDFDRWVGSDDLFFPMEQHVYRAIDWLAENAPADVPVYFSPFTVDHPVLRLREWRLADRPAAAFMPAECLVLNTQPAYYATIPVFTPNFAETLGAYANVMVVKVDDPRYTIYRADPRPVFDAGWTTFGDRLVVQIVDLPPAVLSGDTLELTVAFRRVAAVDQPYTLFAHLYDTAADGSLALVAQDDRPICPGYPPTRWHDGESVVQQFVIPVDGVAQGEFTVGIGIYDSLSLTRLTLDDGSTVLPVHQLRIN